MLYRCSQWTSQPSEKSLLKFSLIYKASQITIGQWGGKWSKYLGDQHACKCLQWHKQIVFTGSGSSFTSLSNCLMLNHIGLYMVVSNWHNWLSKGWLDTYDLLMTATSCFISCTHSIQLYWSDVSFASSVVEFN